MFRMAELEYGRPAKDFMSLHFSDSRFKGLSQ